MENELYKIYSNLKSNQSIGIDGISKQKLDEIIDDEIAIIKRKIENNSYEFSFYKQKLLVKSINKTREISIPTLRDKIVLRYLFNEISNSFKDTLTTKLHANMIISEVIENRENFNAFIKVDIVNFFPSINHEILLDKLKTKIFDENILNLITKAIKQTTVDEKTSNKERIKYNNNVGVPQGLSISGLLAEIYVNDLEVKYNSNNKLKFFRYVDDILILCNKDELENIMNNLKSDFTDLKLTIHKFEKNSTKSSYGNKDDIYEFLGYKFENELISVRNSSVQKMYTNISKLFTLYKNEKKYSKDYFITRLNLKITGCIIENKKYGWISFFSNINDHKLLFQLDRFVRENCEKHNIKYDNIKKFSRAIYEIRNTDSNYIIYDFKKNKISEKDLIIDFYDDIDFY
jgi:RNA-directed DNA polymerase